MKKINIQLLFLFLVCVHTFCFFEKSYSQDFHLSQFYIAPVVFNPAETGRMEEDYRASTGYRDQWRTISNPFTAEQASVDVKILKKNDEQSYLSGGVTCLSERAGAGKMGYWYVGGTVSTNLQVNKTGLLAFGLKGGYGIRSVNMGAFSWDNQWDGTAYNSSLPSGEAGLISIVPMQDYGAGLSYSQRPSNYFSFNAGLSFDHFLRQQISYIPGTPDRLKMKLAGIINAEIKVRGTNKSILPKLLMLKQGPNYEFTPGVLYRYGLGLDSKYTGINRQSAIYFGGFYRTRDAIILTMLYDHKHYFSFGLSYDINLSRLTPTTYAMGGFEITLMHSGILFRKPKNQAVRE